MPELLDAAGAAAYLKFRISRIYRLTSERKLAFSKPTGGKLLFRREDLDAFVARGRHAPDYELADKADELALRAGGRS